MKIKLKCYCDSSQEMIEFIDSLKIYQLISDYDYYYNNEDVSVTHCFEYNGNIFEMRAYGIFSQTILPKNIKKFIDDAFKPDIFICDEDDNLIISIEKTSTAPVGNAVNQRLHRLFYALKNNIPYSYILPKSGYDQSQNMERENTGVLKIISESFNGFNPIFLYDNNIVEEDAKRYESLLDLITEGKIINYSFTINSELNNIPNWSKSEKTAPKNKEFYNKIKEIFKSGKSPYTKAPFSIVDIKEDSGINIPMGKYGLICVPGYKKNGTYSDPNCGDIATFSSFIREFIGLEKIIIYIFQDKSNLTKKKFLSQNNKLVKMCKIYSDYVILHDESIISNGEISLKLTSESSENKVGEDTVTILLALPATLDNEFKLEYIQCPSGSWTYNAIDNNVKRDDIRPDVIIKSINKTISISSKKDIKDLNEKEKDRSYNTDFLIYAVSSKKVDTFNLLENEALIILDLKEGTDLLYFTNSSELSELIHKLYSSKFKVKKANSRVIG